MGYGGYSETSRSLRSTARVGSLVKLEVDEPDLVAKCLTNAGIEWATDGLGGMTARASEATVNKVLATAGLTARNLSPVASAMLGYAHRSRSEVFSEARLNPAMDPRNATLRESRDSAEHPNSLAIVLGLDETGSMGTIPHYLVKEGLPLMIGRIIGGGVPNPQVLFLGIGDHECDQAPLQVGQFESNDELLDKWLTAVWLEGRGGGNDGESYLLAWYFASKHTAIDCFEKRGHKGYCITIGDEPCLPRISEHALSALMGKGQFQTYSALELLDAAREHYNVYHIHVREGSNGLRPAVVDGWRQLLGDNLVIVERRTDVAEAISNIILQNEATLPATPLVRPATAEAHKEEIIL